MMTPQSAPLNHGTPNGPLRSAPFNRWLRYPAGFAKDLTGPLVRPLEPLGPTRLLDPFAGAATLGPWLGTQGHALLGIEANPIVAQVAHLKVSRWPDPTSLRTGATKVLEARESSPGTDDEHPLVRQCFRRETLADLVAIRNALSFADHNSCKYLHAALVATLRDVATSSVGWPYQRPSTPSRARHEDAAQRFAERVDWIAADLEANAQSERALGCVVLGDSRDRDAVANLVGSAGVGACITSPPYLNNYDYADATRLESYFFGVADSWSTMCRNVRDRMIVASTQQSRKEDAERAKEALALTYAGAEIKELQESLRSARKSRPRGKEYDQLIVQYFRDMLCVMGNVAAHMDHGAPLVMAIADSALYGVHVDTPRLTAELASDVGFALLSLEKHRSRGHRWKRSPQRSAADLGEYVLVLERRVD